MISILVKIINLIISKIIKFQIAIMYNNTMSTKKSTNKNTTTKIHCKSNIIRISSTNLKSNNMSTKITLMISNNIMKHRTTII